MANQVIDDEEIPNETASALLRKLEDGAFMNFAGHEVQQLLAKLRQVAAKKNARVTGEITIKVKVAMQKDGYAMPVASVKCKAPEMPRGESMIFVDEDGDLMARPVEKQLALKGLDGGATAPKDPAQPASKSM